MQSARPEQGADAGRYVWDAATWRFYLGALLVLGVVVAAWVFGVGLPYFVNDLHRLPLEEVASGAHDPKDLWPQATSGPLVFTQLVGLLAVMLGPLVAVVVMFLVPFTLWQGRGRTPPATRALAYGTTLLAVLLVGALFSPWGTALTTWRLD